MFEKVLFKDVQNLIYEKLSTEGALIVAGTLENHNNMTIGVARIGGRLRNARHHIDDVLQGVGAFVGGIDEWHQLHAGTAENRHRRLTTFCSIRNLADFADGLIEAVHAGDAAAHNTACDSYSLKLFGLCVKLCCYLGSGCRYIKLLGRIRVDAEVAKCLQGVAAQLLLFTQMFNHISLVL